LYYDERKVLDDHMVGHCELEGRSWMSRRTLLRRNFKSVENFPASGAGMLYNMQPSIA
jgi:hypothetical protein